MKKNIPAYEIVKQENLTDIHSVGYLLRHRKQEPDWSWMENDDENKVFSIAFRTTEGQHRCSPFWSTVFCAVPVNFR